MTPTITAFARSPDRGRGLARDMRVRWALEEAGQPYDVCLVSFEELKAPAHRALHPFGQIPTYEEGELVLFESGAIVFHIAERHAGLLPHDANARARAIGWMFAALNTVEPPIVDRSMATLLERDKSWHAERLAMLDELARRGVQRRRPADGDRAAQVGRIGFAGGASESRRLHRPQRDPAGLPTCFQGSAGGVHCKRREWVTSSSGNHNLPDALSHRRRGGSLGRWRPALTCRPPSETP
jgi:glutathione S-transferase